MPTSAVPRIERVLVTVDFSEHSLAAVRWTADHFAPDAELIFAHVIEPPPATRSEVMRYPSVETIVSKAHVAVEEQLRDLCTAVSTDRCHAEIRVGTPHDELVLLATATGADVIVVARQDLASSGWARIGTTAQRILRKSSVPILLVTGSRAQPPKEVLIAIDESAITADVLKWGSALSRRFSAGATVVHAAAADASDETEKWIAKAMEQVPDGKGMRAKVTRTKSRPAEAITAEARAMDSDLIVLGSRGAGQANQMLFGSVAESILLSAPCPVFVVLPA